MSYENTRRLVNEHIYCEVGEEVEYILHKSLEESGTPFGWEDVENLRLDNSDEIEELAEEKDELEDKYYELEDELKEDEDETPEMIELQGRIDDIEDQINSLEREQEEYKEPLEWWAVSDVLCNELKDRGYVVIDTAWKHYWGRETSGQAIALDGIIEEIADDWYGEK